MALKAICDAGAVVRKSAWLGLVVSDEFAAVVTPIPLIREARPKAEFCPNAIALRIDEANRTLESDCAGNCCRVG